MKKMKKEYPGKYDNQEDGKKMKIKKNEIQERKMK